jgi:RNA polymerase sigma factor (sigma-70 family)
MKTTRFINDYLHAIIVGQFHAEATDAALLGRFANGDDGDAFAELLRRHGPMVLGLARRVVSNRQAAEDVYQATFLVLARRARTLQRAESLAAWLHSVAYRLALRARKAGVRRQQEEARTRTADPIPDPLDELSARELLAVLDEELQRLPDYYRVPLILCGLEGLSQEEAARRLGWSAGSMKGRLERGRAQLRRVLEKRGLTLPAALGGTLLLGECATAVPAALGEATRRVALTGSGASSAVLSLSNHALGMALATKVKSLVGLLAVIGVLSVGLGMWQGPPVPPVAEPAEQQPVAGERRDLHGDPLPDSALLRLGTVQRRAVGARLALSADGKTIIGVRGSQYVHVWDAATGLLIERHQLDGSEVAMPVGGVEVLSPYGRKLATDDHTSEALHVWDVLTGKELRKFPLEGGGAGGGSPGTGPSGLQAAAFSPDENHLAAVIRTGKKYVLRVWDLKNGKEILDTQILDASWTEFLTFTPDGKRLLVSNPPGLSAYDLAGGKRLWLAKEIPSPARYALTPDGKILIQGYGNGIVACDLATGKPIPFENPPPETWDGALAVTPDGKTLLVSGTKGVLVWDLVQGREVGILAGAGEDLVLAADARSLLTNNGLLQRWDLATGKPFYPDTFDQGHAGEVVALAFSADGKRLASGSADGSVRLWDAATARPLHVWRGHEVRRPIRRVRWMKAGVTALDIAPDGSRVVSAGSEGRVRLECRHR